MNGPMRRMLGKRPVGIWLAVVLLCHCIVLGGGGQLLSFVDWDGALRLGFQEDRLDADDVAEKVLAHVEWGVAGADSFLTLPLMVIGLVGVVLRRRWGLGAAMMGTTTWVYMGAAWVLQRYSLVERAGVGEWEKYSGPLVAFMALVVAPCLLVIWGLAANADRLSVGRANSHALVRTGELEPGAVEAFLICSTQVARAFWAVIVRRRLRWNVSDEEIARPLEGDGLIQSGRALNRAITVGAPPEKVWPWIARLGRGSAFYSWDFLDNRGRRHADYLTDVPEPAIGDWCKVLGKIVELEAGRALVWYDDVPFLGSATKLAMCFRLDAIGDGATRVQFRMTAWLPKGVLGGFGFWLAAMMDHVMSTEMLRRVKLLVETYDERRRGGEVNRHHAPHQRDAWKPAAEAAS